MKTPNKPRSKRKQKGVIRVASSAGLGGHPGLPNNLKGGKCGTCWMVADLERTAKESSTPKLRRTLRALANQFRSGNVIFDTNGKTLLEWGKTLRPQANESKLSHGAKTDDSQNAGGVQ